MTYNYNKIYDFQVIKTLTELTTVYCIDLRDRKIVDLGEYTISQIVRILDLNDEEPGRFEFYNIEEKK